MTEHQEPKPKEEATDCHFIKSNFFRVIHADGAWGGPTPSGFIQVAFYSQRTPIPQVLREISELHDGIAKNTGKVEAAGKTGIVREVDVDVLMNIETAKAVHTWLGHNIKKLEEQHRKLQEFVKSHSDEN